MLNHRREARQHLSFTIASNCEWLLWHDPWLLPIPLIQHLGSHMVSMVNSSDLAKVSSIISNNSWDLGSSNHVLVIELRNLLSSCLISRTSSAKWDGCITSKMAVVWQSIRRTATPPPWCVAIWHPLSVKNCSIYLWLALRNRLLTKDRMIAFGMNVDANCALCRCHAESAEHLFFACPYTYLLRRGCPLATSFSWNDWKNGNFFHEHHSALKQNLGYLYIAIMVYMVWKERNARIHHSHCINSVTQLQQKIKAMLRERVWASTSFKKRVVADPSLCSLLY